MRNKTFQNLTISLKNQIKRNHIKAKRNIHQKEAMGINLQIKNNKIKNQETKNLVIDQINPIINQNHNKVNLTTNQKGSNNYIASLYFFAFYFNSINGWRTTSPTISNKPINQLCLSAVASSVLSVSSSVINFSTSAVSFHP